ILNLLKEIVIYDTEYTIWEGAQKRNWSGPGEYREVVNIGAIKIETENFRVLDSLDLFIKPFKNPILSKYFISLTSITQEEVDTKGISLKVAMREFVKWCGRLQLYSYGPDHERLIENCALIDIPFLLKKENCHDVRDIFRMHGIPAENYMSSTIVRAFGQEPTRQAHTGVDDSRAIADALRLLKLREH